MSQISPHEGRPKTDTISKAEHFLFSFIKAKNDILIYPPTNPVVNESIEEALKLLKESFGAGHAVELLVEKDRLLVDGSPVGSADPRVSKLALALYRRSVRRIIVDSSITFDEMRLLLDALNMKAEEIAEAGGITALIESRRIRHATVEETAELKIVEGANLSIADDMLPELEGLEDLDINVDELGSASSFNRMFVRVEEGDLASVKRLRKLLENPELFAGLLERFALQIEKVRGNVDAGTRVKNMIEILQTVGSAIASLPSEDERSQLMNNLAASVLGLSANLRAELVHQGMMPNLTLNSIESNILSRFPVVDLADAILENFQVSGAAASVMASCLGNLDLSRADKSELTETLHYSLKRSGKLTPEIEALLTSAKAEAEAEAETDESKTPEATGPLSLRADFDVPRIEGYPPEKILFDPDEKAELLSRIPKELESPAADVMAATLMELLSYERSPQNYAFLLERVSSYIENFLSNRDYDAAAALIQGLRDEQRQKAQVFSPVQMKPLEEILARFVGESGIRPLISAFRRMNRESSEFEQITGYFAALGLPAINALLRSLEDEQSRHVRLLTCQALVQIGEPAIEAVAGMLDHPQWYVVRNAVSILGQIGTAECVVHLQKALSHPEARVRRAALKGLASMRTDEAIGLICDCIHADNSELCKAALQWIAVIGPEQALPSLERLLCDGEIWKKSDDVVKSAIEALGAIHTEAAIARLEKLSEIHRLFRRKRAALIREAASAALRKIEGKKNK